MLIVIFGTLFEGAASRYYEGTGEPDDGEEQSRHRGFEGSFPQNSYWHVKERGCFVLFGFPVGIEYFFIDHVDGLN